MIDLIAGLALGLTAGLAPTAVLVAGVWASTPKEKK